MVQFFLFFGGGGGVWSIFAIKRLNIVQFSSFQKNNMADVPFQKDPFLKKKFDFLLWITVVCHCI